MKKEIQVNYKTWINPLVHWQPTYSRCIYEACIYWSILYLDLPSEQLSESSQFEEFLLLEIKFSSKRKKNRVLYSRDFWSEIVTLRNSKLIFLRTSNFLSDSLSIELLHIAIKRDFVADYWLEDCHSHPVIARATKSGLVDILKCINQSKYHQFWPTCVIYDLDCVWLQELGST